MAGHRGPFDSQQYLTRLFFESCLPQGIKYFGKLKPVGNTFLAKFYCKCQFLW